MNYRLKSRFLNNFLLGNTRINLGTYEFHLSSFAASRISLDSEQTDEKWIES